MFKQTSQFRKSISKLLTVAAVSILFAAGASSVSAQFKGLKRVSKAVLTVPDIVQNVSIDIDQCANGGVSDPPIQCAGAAWQNGNLNGNQAHYHEGDSVPFRDVMTGLTIGGAYTIAIEFDATEGGNHAYDYFTTFNRIETTADPCGALCTLGSPTSTIAIPTDSLVVNGENGVPGDADDITQLPGVFTLWGGSFSGTPTYGLSGTFPTGTSKRSITLTFTANAESAVLAWGGHISTRLDWGFDNSAIVISGSSYHMRNLSFSGPGFNGNVGNQDRSLAENAVFADITVTIVKQVQTFDGTNAFDRNFIFNGTNLPVGSPGSFTLNDTFAGDTNDAKKVLSYTALPGGSVTITEATDTQFSLNDITCTINNGGGNFPVGTATDNFPAGRTATINALEGNVVVCTFVNGQNFTTAANASISGRVMTKAGYGIRGALVTVFDASTQTSKVAITNSFGYYTFTELPVDDFYILNVSAKRYAFSNGQQSFVLDGDLTDVSFTSDQ